MSECVITGCTLVYGGTWVGGDLHEEGDCYIFNAIIDGSGRTSWNHTSNEAPFYRKHVTVKDPTFFDRRGVIVVAKNACELNDEAKRYIGHA